jgi:hypothetical protein
LRVTRSGAVVATKDTVLDVHVLGVDLAGLLASLAAEIDPLTPLPGLRAQEEQACRNEHDSPFPGNWCVLEDHRVQSRNINEREECDEAGENSPKEELVAPNIDSPLCEIAIRVGLHAEEGSTHINHFPCEEQCKPCQACECCSSGTKDQFARLAIGFVASGSQVPVAKAVDDQDEARKTQQCDPEAIHDHVDDEFHGEDAGLERHWWTLQNVGYGSLKSKTHVGKSRRRHDDPDDLYRCEWVYGESSAVFEHESDQESTCLCNIFRQDVEHKFLDVIENSATFFDGGKDRRKVVVRQDNIRSLLGDIGAGLSHGNANVGALERG